VTSSAARASAWVGAGLQALEARLASDTATEHFSHGDTPGLADCCLVPQLYNARPFNCDLSVYPARKTIEQHCQALDAFQEAAPEWQPDGGGDQN